MATPLVKKAHQELEYTPHQISELRRCTHDLIYFVKMYVKTLHPTRGMIAFKLYPYQEEMLMTFLNEKYVTVLSARQTGKSVCSAAFLLWFAAFNNDKTILIASNKNKSAMEMIHRIKQMYEELPMWLKPGVTADGWNKHELHFDNGSRIISEATTENSGRGFSISKLYLDEFAFVKIGIQKDFWASISPVLATGGDCIITSTPNGDHDQYAELWRGAVAEVNGFKAIFVPWDAPPGRDEKFKREEMSKIGERRWRQEYECEFLSSDATLIDGIALRRLTESIFKTKPIAKINIKGYAVYFWKEMTRGKTYLLGVDPSTGIGNDFSAIEIFEFPSMEQVAEFRSNVISTNNLYMLTKSLLEYLHNKNNNAVFFTVENNGVGEGMLALYQHDEKPPPGEFLSDDSGRMGFNTNGKTKVVASIKLKDLVETDKLKFSSKILLHELKTLTKKGQTYTAQAGSTDDCVSATLLIVRMIEILSTFDDKAYEALYNINKPDEVDEWDLEKLMRKQSDPNYSSEQHMEDEPLPMVF